jgi:pilus assembly protein Flp/PilA
MQFARSWTGCAGDYSRYGQGFVEPAQNNVKAKMRERAEMNKLFKQFIKSEDGVTALEYGLIAGLIALVIGAAVQTLGGDLQTVFQHVANCVTNASTCT